MRALARAIVGPVTWPIGGVQDYDARNYIRAVELADGQPLEAGVRRALDAFVRGCKSDGIWDAIKASCIMMGARTLAGALVPLKGTAPTNYNFVSGDYDRKTGLKGNGTTKYLSTNRTYAELTLQNSGHYSVFVATDSTTANKTYVGSYDPGGIARDGASRHCGLVNSASFQFVNVTASVTGLKGVSRSNSTSQTVRLASTNYTVNTASAAPLADAVLVYHGSVLSSGAISAARLSYYSIGESIALDLLDTRVTALRNAIATSLDGVTDPDARAYINAVEAADGQTLEVATAQAISNFIVGCKSDGIWDAIKASCIMMGARTLAGALVPLKGAAPTNYNFVSGDYDRKIGLVGDGTTKYLNANRAQSADPRDSVHASVFVSVAGAGGVFQAYISSYATTANRGVEVSRSGAAPTSIFYAANSTAVSPATGGGSVGLYGVTRSDGVNLRGRAAGTTHTLAVTSSASTTSETSVFRRPLETPTGYAAVRLSFYSIGESLDLALLDTRVTALSTAISAAI